MNRAFGRSVCRVARLALLTVMIKVMTWYDCLCNIKLCAANHHDAKNFIAHNSPRAITTPKRSFIEENNKAPRRYFGLRRGAFIYREEKLIFLVTDVGCLCGVKHQVEDGCYQPIDSEGDHRQENVSQSSGGVALRLQIGMVDNNAADPTEEKGE